MSLKLRFFLMFLFAIFLSQNIFSANCGGNVNCSCGDTVTSNYVMREDLVCDDGSGLILKALYINCDGHTIKGSGARSGVIVPGLEDRKYRKVFNCNIENFGSGINIGTSSHVECFWGLCRTVIDYSYKTEIFNNSFLNNTYGIYTKEGKSDKFYDNVFVNNREFGIYLKESSSSIWNNIFYNTSIYYTETSGKSFCQDGVGNVYVGNLTGPACGCFIPFNGLLINSNAKLCFGTYNLPDGFKITSNDIALNCQGAKILGSGINNGIIVKARNNLITNCFISNYSLGISYSTYTTPNTKPGFAQNVYHNAVYNSTIINVNRGINMYYNTYTGNYGRVETLHNNIISARDYNLYNNPIFIVSATDNWWGSENETIIESKFLKPENVIYKPFVQLGDVDIWIEDVDFGLNSIRLFVGKSTKLPLQDFKVEVIDVYDYKVVSKNEFNVSGGIIGEEIIEDLSVDLKDDHKYYFVLNVSDDDLSNNYFEKTYTGKSLVYLNLSLDNVVLEREVRDYLEFELGEKYIVDDLNDADVVVSAWISVENKSWNEAFVFSSERLPYEGVVSSDKGNISIVGFGVEGILQGVKELIKDKDNFFSNKLDLVINHSNQEALGIYSYMHSFTNYKYYDTQTNVFGDEIREVLYDDMFDVRELSVPVDWENGTINYRLWRLLPEHDLNYLEYVDSDLMPIVMGGGLWSDIHTWEELGRELANDGYEVYLVELTGGDESECDNCYDYPYDFLTDDVYPAYVDVILNVSGRDRIKYVGHSNGARVALDSLTKGEVNPNLVDTFVAVGVPGAFEDLSHFAGIINDSGAKAIERLNRKGITHVTFSRVAHELDSGLGEAFSFANSFANERISTNLFKQYFSWINSTNDIQPGNGLSLEHFTLLYGNWILGEDDTIVPVVDELNIFSNVYSSNKYINFSVIKHTDMTDDVLFNNYILMSINKKIYENEKKY